MTQSRYVLTDLDGTLLRSDATLSAYTVEVLHKLVEKGIVLSCATARSFTSTSAVTSAFSWPYPMVLYNGAVLFDPVQKNVLNGFWLEAAIVDTLLERGRSFGLLPLLFTMDEEHRERVLHEKLHRAGDLMFYRSRPGDPRFTEVQRLHCPAGHRPFILTYIGYEEELQPLREAVSAEYHDQVHIGWMKDSYMKDHYFLEFSHPQANKRDGLRLWADWVGCRPEDILVFGDQLNDIGLFEQAGQRIAVGNAHPEIRRLADRVVQSNDDDGVARYLEGVFLSNSKEGGGDNYDQSGVVRSVRDVDFGIS